MKNGKSNKKLRSHITCKDIQNPCKQLASSYLIRTDIRNFIQKHEQISCDKIICQHFRKPKFNEQMI